MEAGADVVLTGCGQLNTRSKEEVQRFLRIKIRLNVRCSATDPVKSSIMSSLTLEESDKTTFINIDIY